MIKTRIRTIFNKLKFSCGLIPTISKTNKATSSYIKDPYKAVCLISADFELAWAFRYSKRSRSKALKLGAQTRKNVPEILKLSEKYNIPVTWATVGHLFLKECRKHDGIAHPEIKRLPFFHNEFWSFEKGDWFEDDPCTDFQKDPEWYCPDLIESIIKSPIRHEIGCHTFSHIDCKDGICSDEVFLSEMNACKIAAHDFNIEMKSFVHPGHQIGNLTNLARLGYTSFRTDYGDTLSFPKLDPSGLWELQNTAIIDYRKDWTVNYHIKRYKTIIRRAIKNNKVCVLWFHPSFDPIVVKEIIPKVFEFLDENKDNIWITTHSEYINWLNQNKIKRED